MVYAWRIFIFSPLRNVLVGKCKRWEVKQSYYLARIFWVVYSSWLTLIKFFSFSVLERVPSFPPWLKLFIYLFISSSFQFRFFSHNFLNSRKFSRWNMWLNIPGFSSINSVIDSSSIISVIDETLIKFLPVVSVTLSSINSVILERLDPWESDVVYH